MIDAREKNKLEPFQTSRDQYNIVARVVAVLVLRIGTTSLIELDS